MTKKRDLERELILAGWVKLKGVGSAHDKFRKGSKVIVVPRHRELNDITAEAIRKEAGIWPR